MQAIQTVASGPLARTIIKTTAAASASVLVVPVRTVSASTPDQAPRAMGGSGGVDWDKIKLEQQRRERLAMHATAKPLSTSQDLSNQVDWEKIKSGLERRRRLAAHATNARLA